jgi:hypothetical protein
MMEADASGVETSRAMRYHALVLGQPRGAFLSRHWMRLAYGYAWSSYLIPRCGRPAISRFRRAFGSMPRFSETEMGEGHQNASRCRHLACHWQVLDAAHSIAHARVFSDDTASRLPLPYPFTEAHSRP